MRALAAKAVLVLGGWLAFGRPGEASASLESARGCLTAAGFGVANDAEDPSQLLVTTASGTVTTSTDGDTTTTLHHDASLRLTFFASEDEAKTFENGFAALGAQLGATDPTAVETVGSVLIDWAVAAPETEREAVLSCVSA